MGRFFNRKHSDQESYREKNKNEVEDKASNETDISEQDEDQEEEIILPTLPPEKSFMGMEENLAYWGFSQRGESHIKNDLPCQDRCKSVIVNQDSPMVISVIADGVGSCVLSHYGAEIATGAAIDFLKEKLDNYGKKQLEDSEIGNLLRGAMQYAYEVVKKSAEEMEQLEYSFQSTLTIAIYDGKTLYTGHAGDDGIVVITDDGKPQLVTSRIKGEEASSVYPLQAGSNYWQVFKVSQQVNGFVMATDGVLDAFVRGEKEKNRIYYPFIQPAFESEVNNEKDLKEILDYYYQYMAGKEYRKSVTDDLTILVVTNLRELKKTDFLKFDEEEWNAQSEEYKAKVNAALYPQMEEKKASKNTSDQDIEIASIQDKDGVDKNTSDKREVEIDTLDKSETKSDTVDVSDFVSYEDKNYIYGETNGYTERRKICPKCGYYLLETEKFCSNCGKKWKDPENEKNVPRREISIFPGMTKRESSTQKSRRRRSEERQKDADRKQEDDVKKKPGKKQNVYDKRKIIILSVGGIVIVILAIVLIIVLLRF